MSVERLSAGKTSLISHRASSRYSNIRSGRYGIGKSTFRARVRRLSTRRVAFKMA
jgi:hypothetical protein